MIIPRDSPLCGMCKKVVNCPCECHISDIVSGYHVNVYSLPLQYTVKNEGKPPERADYILMRIGKMPKSLRYRIREPFRKLLR